MGDMPRGDMATPPTSGSEMPVGEMQSEPSAATAGSTMPAGNGAGEMPAGTMPNVGNASAGDMPA